LPSPSSPPPLPRRRRAKRRAVPWLRLVILVGLLSWFGWASTTPGGVSARVNGFIDQLRGDVEQATADPSLRRAAEALDAVFQRDGRYPAASSPELRDDPAYGIGVGVEVMACGPRDVVVVGLTGRGTVSRLLVDGKVVGDVAGSAPCPADPDQPRPWRN
jgi:hypothetical protein